MTKARSPLAGIRWTSLWQEFWLRYYFKFTLPKLNEITLDGLRLDVSALPLTARNRMLNVGYETQEKLMCRDFLSPDDSVVELGAAVGFLGLFCQKKLGIQKYVLFEANPRTFALLKRNYQLNGLDPVAWNLALAPVDGRIELNVDGEFWENSILQGHAGARGRKTMEVGAATLATLLAKVNQKFNVLIIDIEGAEQFIDFDAIPQEVSKIIIELHPAILGPETTYDIVARLIAKGFCVAREADATFVFLKRPKRSANLDSFSAGASGAVNGWHATPRNGIHVIQDMEGVSNH